MNSWIIPCNVKFYDVINHFKNTDTIIWKRGIPAKNGDLVYLYVGIPYKQILFRCQVIDEKLPEEEIGSEKYAIMKGSNTRLYMRLKLVEAWNEGIPLEKLNEFGIVLVRKQTRLTGSALNYISNYKE